MTDNDLKKKKKAMLKFIFEKLEKVKSERTLKDILQKVANLNAYFDNADSTFKNILDKVGQALHTTSLGKIQTILNDILDNYDKKDRDGEYVYSDDERKMIGDLFQEINDICDRTLWDKFKDVFKYGL